MRLREADTNDREFLIEMARLACSLEDRPIPSANAPAVLALLPSPSNEAVIATEEDESAVGAAWWHMHDPPLLRDVHGRAFPEMVLAVVEGARNRGVGGTLIDALALKAADLYEALTLNVHIRSPAIGLYLRSGFEVMGAGRGIYGVTMGRRLDTRQATEIPRADRPSIPRFELSGREHLRLLEESDAPELYAVVDANRAHLAPWMPWASEQTLEDTLDFIRRTRQQLESNDGFQTAIIEEGHIVGIVGFHGISWPNRLTRMGYWLAVPATGHGTVTRAVRVLVDYAFDAWQLNRVEIRVGVDNARSRAIPERLGFTQEGILQQAEYVGGRYIDHVVYALLASGRRRTELAS
jgi:ribosomal-protein-serine acetyltransferase